MKYRKSIKILATLFLLLNVFANSALAEVCFCGNTCLHSFQTKTKANSLFHLRCSGNLCKSCDLEKGKIFKAANSTNKALDTKIFDTALIIFAQIDYPSIYHTLEDFDSFYTCKIIVSSPIYIQNLSILC